MNNMAINLSKWIDVVTGDVLRNLNPQDGKELLKEVHRHGVAQLLGMGPLHASDPYVLLSATGLSIKLSEKIIYRTVKVYPGISAKPYREIFDDWEEPGDFPEEKYPGNTREMPIEHQYAVLGEFRPSSTLNKIGIIWLYPRAMASSKYRKVADFETVFWATLAHEAFHAFHYYHLKLEGKADRWLSGRKKDRELVLESLAAYFEYSFLDYMLDDPHWVQKYKEDEWSCWDIDGWYYSGALGILNSRKSARLFASLFEMSFNDWKTAADVIRTGYYMSNEEIADWFARMR